MNSTLRSLDREWATLARSPIARRSLMHWTARHEALTGMHDLAEVLEARLDAERAPAILAALAERAPVDEVAARTLLQALVPGLVTLARYAGPEDPAAIEEVVSLAWERIRTYPPTRQGSVAGNVLLDVKKRYRQHRSIEQPTSSWPMPTDPTTGIDETEAEVLGRQVLVDLARAREAGVVSPKNLEWIVRTRMFGDGIAEVAAEEALPERTVCQRRWRAERRLRSLPLAG